MNHLTRLNDPLTWGNGAWCSPFTASTISDENRARYHVLVDAIDRYIDNNDLQQFIDTTTSLRGSAS